MDSALLIKSVSNVHLALGANVHSAAHIAVAANIDFELRCVSLTSQCRVSI